MLCAKAIFKSAAGNQIFSTNIAVSNMVVEQQPCFLFSLNIQLMLFQVDQLFHVNGFEAQPSYTWSKK